MRQAIFLDRDGVINQDIGHLCRAEDCVFIPEAIEGLKRASRSHCKIIIATNQAGIAKGKFSEDQYHAFMEWMLGTFASRNIRIDGVYHCPDHPDATIEHYRRDSPNRKPNPGMLLQAAQDHCLDLSWSWMIGDKTSDIEAGRRAGCRTMLVRTGYAGRDGICPTALPDVITDNLDTAIRVILG